MMPHDTSFKTLEFADLIKFTDSAGQSHFIWCGKCAPPGMPPGHLTIGNILLTRPDCAALAKFLNHFAETGEFPA